MAKNPSTRKVGAGKSAPADLETRLVDAMLELAETEGWRGVTMTAIALGAGAALSEIYPAYRSRLSVLDAFFERVDRAVVASPFTFAPEDGARDRLFEVLMRRFDALQPHREAIRRISRGARRDPVTAAFILRRQARSMAWMLEAAGLSSDGACGAVKAAGLAGVWLSVLPVWLADESEDLSRTMAALDRGLGRADRCAATVFNGRHRPEPAAG